MGILDFFLGKINKGKSGTGTTEEYHEFCPRCQADIVMQKGFSASLPYWVCKGCGEMLINPAVEADDEILWQCDSCESVLNIQDGFTEECGEWKCLECGFSNRIDMSEVYLSVDEYESEKQNPYKGLSDEAVLELSMFEELGTIGNRDNVTVVRSLEDDRLYVKKILSIYDATVFEYLLEHPVEGMPRLVAVYEGTNSLIVIEEYIEGATLEEKINEKLIEPLQAVSIAKCLATILMQLHGFETPIIHRDLKPSNVIISEDGAVYLLDINVAKWFKEGEIEDTRLLGTPYYAAPEQLGYGSAASSAKTDIYSLGVILNIMITGHFPKEKRAEGPVWEIIEKCICYEAADRYDDAQLMEALESVSG